MDVFELGFELSKSLRILGDDGAWMYLARKTHELQAVNDSELTSMLGPFRVQCSTPAIVRATYAKANAWWADWYLRNFHSCYPLVASCNLSQRL